MQNEKEIGNSIEKPQKISFLEIERFLENEMDEREKNSFQQKVANNKALEKYLKKTSGLKSDLRFNLVQKPIQPEKEPADPSRLSLFTLFKILWAGLHAGPGLVYAGIICLITGLAFLIFIGGRETSEKQLAYASKGQIGFRLHLKGVPLKPGKVYAVVPGDTLYFSYRSDKSLHVQVWYRDDDGDLHAYIENSGTSLFLEPSTQWTGLSQKIVLDNDWKTEALYLVFSSKAFSSNTAKEQIFESTNVGGFFTKRYILQNSAQAQE